MLVLFIMGLIVAEVTLIMGVIATIVSRLVAMVEIALLIVGVIETVFSLPLVLVAVSLIIGVIATTASLL